MKKTKSKPASPEAASSAALAHWDPALRTYHPLDLLRQQMETRVPELAPIKYQRMACDPFGFFRGAALLMAADLALTPNSGVINQICGDAHVQNLGSFASLDDHLIFDINDFDETFRAPFEWDVKRMATSIVLAGRQGRLKKGACLAASEAFLGSYCNRMRVLSRMPYLDIMRHQVHIPASSAVAQILRKARRELPAATAERLTVPKGKSRIFKSDPPLLRRVTGAEADVVLASLEPYLASLEPERRRFFTRYRPLDVAFKVVGVGSVGTLDYCVYMEGNGPGDPLFLQIKEEPASCYKQFLPPDATLPTNQGQRVVDGQRAMQIQSDPLLGWTQANGKDFLVRLLHDHKAAVDVTTLDLAGLSQYARICGALLARGHARSGDVLRLAAYIGKPGPFKKAIQTYASAYADQTEQDWKALIKSPEGRGLLQKT